MNSRAGAQPSPLIGRLQLQQRRHHSSLCVSMPNASGAPAGRLLRFVHVYTSCHEHLRRSWCRKSAPEPQNHVDASRQGSPLFGGCSPSNRGQQIEQHLPAPLIPAADKDQAAGRLTRIRARTGESTASPPPESPKQPSTAQHGTAQHSKLSSVCPASAIP